MQVLSSRGSARHGISKRTVLSNAEARRRSFVASSFREHRHHITCPRISLPTHGVARLLQARLHHTLFAWAAIISAVWYDSTPADQATNSSTTIMAAFFFRSSLLSF